MLEQRKLRRYCHGRTTGDRRIPRQFRIGGFAGRNSRKRSSITRYYSTKEKMKILELVLKMWNVRTDGCFWSEDSFKLELYVEIKKKWFLVKLFYTVPMVILEYILIRQSCNTWLERNLKVEDGSQTNKQNSKRYGTLLTEWRNEPN